ncbi:MAG: hypothetical protein CL828_07170 [Crocinitomicaceae bacterium]|jgi:hypothetical protein|nr:hypothetical protein [Crocinitomicaceae bacterium]|tara:strand:- start:5107 stop:5421 length:315 start_codon:yes stop_codon:yes gene_type:complete
MRNIFTTLLMIVFFGAMAQNITVVQINAKWNKVNDFKITDLPSSVKYKFAYLEDQNNEVKSQIQAVPVIIVYKGSEPVKQWNANLSFKLEVKEEDIIAAVRAVQ